MSEHQPGIEHGTTTDVEMSEPGIDLFAVTVALLTEWRLGLITFAVVSIVCIAFVFSLKPQFVATATLLPQSGRTETGSLTSLFSNRGPGALYVGLLQSRSVQENVIERANLLQLFHTNSVETARAMLAGKSNFVDGLDTLVTITVRDGNAQDASRMANGYLEALQNLNDTMALQQSSQTTRFFQHQLEDERQQLSEAELQLARIQKQTGLVAPEQTQIGLGAIASIRADIQARRVQLTALLQSETEQNPQVQTLRSQIAQLQSQEAAMEAGSGGTPVGAAPSAVQMPQNNLDILRAQREVRYHEALVTSLSNQFETARMSETFARSAFQVVDRAVAPERKAWPPRKPFVAGCILFGIVMGFIVVICKLAWRRIQADPNHETQLAQLRKAFGSR